MERQHGAFHEAHLRKRGPTAQPREQLERNNGDDDVYVDSGRCLALGTCRDDSRVTVHKSRLQGLSGFSMPQPGFMHSKPHGKRSTYCLRWVATPLDTQTEDVRDVSRLDGDPVFV